MMLVLCDSDSFAGFSLNKAVPKKQYCTSTDQPGSWISVEEEEKEKTITSELRNCVKVVVVVKQHSTAITKI